MIQVVSNPTNEAKTGRLHDALEELLRQALRRGFHGTARLEFAIQDGVIQHIRRALEQLEK